MSPAVTVVVPTRDRAEFLPGLLAALRTQRFADFEVIVVDDGSTDDTATVLGDLVADDARIRVLSGPNRGPAQARNQAVDAAVGEWLAFTDDDCLPEPGWLAALVATAVAEGADIVQGRTDDDRSVQPDDLSLLARGKVVARWSGRFQMCNLLVRRDRYRSAGGLDPRFPPHGFGEDTDLGLRLVAAGATTAFCADGVVRHRMIDMTFPQFLRRRWRWAQVVRVAAINPDGWTTFPHKYVGQRSHVAFWLGAGVAAAAAGRGHRWVPLVGLAGYTAQRVHATRTSSRSVRTRVVRAPLELAGVAVESVGFLVESARHRRLLL